MAAHKFVGIWKFQADLAWAGLEYATKLATLPMLHMSTPPAAQRRPVMTLPGFTGSERTLGPMNQFLNAKGYDAFTWGLGTNRGHSSIPALRLLVDTLVQRVEAMAERHDSTVSLIGHSLGGIYARELARLRPDLVDRVITLGTPSNPHPDHPERLNQTISAIFDSVSGRPGEQNAQDMLDAGIVVPPPGVPVVSVFSPFDGVVGEDASRIPDEHLTCSSGAPRENLKINGSHVGMIVNPLALAAIADRLQADLHNWKPYQGLTPPLPWPNSTWTKSTWKSAEDASSSTQKTGSRA